MTEWWLVNSRITVVQHQIALTTIISLGIWDHKKLHVCPAAFENRPLYFYVYVYITVVREEVKSPINSGRISSHCYCIFVFCYFCLMMLFCILLKLLFSYKVYTETHREPVYCYSHTKYTRKHIENLFIIISVILFPSIMGGAIVYWTSVLSSGTSAVLLSPFTFFISSAKWASEDGREVKLFQ
jgi:hypothetical protein